ncbi:DUF1572 family protein [Flavobacterium muglaense]|uniref:DUF1572 family protein n=1 Tax=Flavobacterium muglaense TaxID=2764716 RepID=A0A923N179_9FLAO|nr:DUF1572 family protein [Flavobacterium muglaense]MBC5838883.1 DUF1572 family protein [Flavobacterium muglaense]MBC5845377.1 DUF1572 family protein [Flavobacterium muglaense]
MSLTTLQTLFNRDLNRLKVEIELYQNDAQIWAVDKQVSNSAGNLCLHLVGNLNAYIGSALGKTDYIRNRPLEFSLKNIATSDLLLQIDSTISTITTTLNSLTEEDLQKEYPIIVFEQKTSTEFMLIHLTTHLAYHLGQINYHRRLLDQ